MRIHALSLTLIGFKLIGKNEDYFTSFRYDIMGGHMQYAYYSAEKELKLQTTGSGLAIRLDHIKTIEQLAEFHLLLTGERFGG